VSYSWGGDDGDYAKNSPVYVGPWWDVLRQTRNYWEVLRRLWIKRGGTRPVWIDTICINQADMDDRNTQVGLIHITYTRCTHVFTYLGDSHPRGGGDKEDKEEEPVASVSRFFVSSGRVQDTLYRRLG